MVKNELPIIYSQWDSRWANILLGYNTDPKYNFYNYGCLLFCLTMAANYYGKIVTPDALNNHLKAVNGYKAGTGLYLYGSLNKIYGDIVEKTTKTPLALTNEQIGAVRNALDGGFVVMLEIDVNPATVANDQHFVLAVGYNPADENDIIIADPLGGRERSLKDYIGIYRPSARRIIEGYTIIEGPKPAPGPKMVCLSKDDADRRTHNSEQWIKTVGYLGISKDPTLTQFEEAQAVVAGIKSRSTDLETKLDTANTNLAGKTQEVDNLNKQISTLKADMLKQEKEYLARIKAINDSMPDTSKITGEYEATIKELRGKLEVTVIDRDSLKIELAKAQTAEKDITEMQTGIAKLWEFVRKYILGIFSATK
jgi:hypothetical protein